MKILQLNIWGGNLGKNILEILNEESPDIVCFQEVVSFPTDGDLFFSALSKFQKELSYEESFFSPVFGFTYMNHKAEFGNAILSKHSFQHKATVFTRKTYIDNQDMLDGDFNIRNLQHVTVNTEMDLPLHILNHHGHHIHEHKNGDEETMRQCKMIADYIQTLPGDIVLCGDFNLAPDSQSLEQINQLLENQCIAHEIRTTRTPLTKKTEVCDYIFTSRNIRVKRFEILEKIASDHAALIVEF